jgi:RNA polymerase sigma-70 factor (ECF subfamily)
MVAEKILIKGLKNGHEEAFRSLMEQYGTKLFQTCCLILKDKQDAEDVVQETFIRVFKNINNFRGDSGIYTWIYRIAVNLSRDKMKKGFNYLPLEDEHIAGDDVEGIIVGEFDKQALRDGLYRLDPIYREALVLFYFRDFSVANIAEILDENEGTIKSRLSRGRKILKESLLKGGMLNEYKG